MKRGELKGKIEELVDSAFEDQPIERERSFLPFNSMGLVLTNESTTPWQFVAVLFGDIEHKGGFHAY